MKEYLNTCVGIVLIKVAVVGASKLTTDEVLSVKDSLENKFNQFIFDYGINNVTVISGGAKGVDSLAEEVAKTLGIDTIIFNPEIPHWEDQSGKIGYKTRNIKIAESCDILYCYPVELRDMRCYHCNQDHQVSGGCWTLKQASKLKKQVFLINPKKR